MQQDEVFINDGWFKALGITNEWKLSEAWCDWAGQLCHVTVLEKWLRSLGHLVYAHQDWERYEDYASKGHYAHRNERL